MAPPVPSGIAMAFAASSSASASASATTNKPYSMKPTSAISAAVKHASGMPLTPPNSVSPNLPAHASRPGLSSPPPIQIDGDIDLEDAMDHAAAQDQPPVPLSKGALSGLESSQFITASMLAKHHLPGIILGHGPVAIRHVMACLTHTLPGFSRIAPAKARRLVVAALESRSGGGVHGDVVFEKIGWGRWDAHKKGEPPNFSASFRDGKLSPPTSEAGSYGASYNEPGVRIAKMRNDRSQQQSWAGSWMPQSSFGEHLDDMSMAGHEADKMSLDGSSTEESEEDGSTTSDSAGDETEDEDWAAIGPDTLRKASLSTAASTSVRRNYNLLSIPGTLENARRSSTCAGSRSRSPFQTWSSPQHPRRPSVMTKRSAFSTVPEAPGDGDAMEVDQTFQEKEAIEALLRMGSM